MKSLRHACLLALCALGMGMGTASAQTFPSKTLRWVVAYPPGGGTDILARTVGAQMSRQMNQPIVIDNRPGGAGIIGAENVSRSAPDGYTLFSGDNGTLVYNPALYKSLPYDPAKAFSPISMLGRFPLVLLTNNESPFTSARELIDQAKRQPGKLSYASPGIGSPHHLAMELLKQEAGVFVLHVPYRGSGGAIQDLIGGRINLFVADSAVALPMIKGGKVRPLAVFSQQRSVSFSEVPTWSELGYKKVQAYGWQGMVVPAGTPSEVISVLNRELGAALKAPEVARSLADFGVELIPGTSQEMASFLESETRVWQPLIRERGIKPE